MSNRTRSPRFSDGGNDGGGAREGETLEQLITPDKEIVAQLVSMGFSDHASRRAAVAVRNSSADAATEWVLGHTADGDLNASESDFE